MVKTITGALRAVKACKNLDDLVALDARLSVVAWNDGGEIRNAIEAKRSALLGAETDGPEFDSADAYARAFPAHALAASRGESHNDWKASQGYPTEPEGESMTEDAIFDDGIDAVEDRAHARAMREKRVATCSGCGHPHGGPDCAVF